MIKYKFQWINNEINNKYMIYSPLMINLNILHWKQYCILNWYLINYEKIYTDISYILINIWLFSLFKFNSVASPPSKLFANDKNIIDSSINDLKFHVYWCNEPLGSINVVSIHAIAITVVLVQKRARHVSKVNPNRQTKGLLSFNSGFRSIWSGL